MKISKVFLWFGGIIIPLILLASPWAIVVHQRQAIKDLAQKFDNLQAMTSPMERTTIRDTVNVVTQKVIRTERVKEYQSDSDRELLRDLSVKASAIAEYHKMGIVTADTVKVLPDSSKSVFRYHDKWTDIYLSSADSSLAYAVRDSLAVVVHREYKYRFLWWQWRIKGYKVSIANFNPKSTVLYNEYIKVQ